MNKYSEKKRSKDNTLKNQISMNRILEFQHFRKKFLTSPRYGLGTGLLTGVKMIVEGGGSETIRSPTINDMAQNARRPGVQVPKNHQRPQ